MVHGDRGSQCDRPVDAGERGAGLPGLQGQHAQHVKAVGMHRHRGEHLTVHLLRLGEAAGAVQPHTLLEMHLDRVFPFAHGRF